MEVNSICRPYRKYNEDMVIVIKDHLFIVIDAATGLCDPFHEPSDGVYLLNILKKELLDLYHKGKLNPKFFVNQMNRISRKYYRQYIKGKGELERYQFPSAGIAICYIDICNVHLYSIGDVSSYVKLKKGKDVYISDKSIPILDKKTYEKYHQKGVYRFEDMYETLRYNRSLLNKNGRKPSYSLYKNPHLKFKHQRFDINDLDSVYLCSDGYYAAFETFKLFKSRKELFARNVNLESVYKKVNELSIKDVDCLEYPRVKQLDDVSAIKVEF